MGNLLPEPVKISTDDELAVLGNNCSMQTIAQYIKEGRANNVVLMVGAGISVSAGIPDFRTPGTGLYSNLQKYNLPKPEAMFDIDQFQDNPAPFYDLAKHLLPSNFNPTPTHFFIKMLEKKGVLKRCYSQNIDTLERQAGVSAELLVEAHGSFGSAKCTSCKTAVTSDYFKEKVEKMVDGVRNADGDPIPWCKCDQPNCSGNVKPDIVFFGEDLPRRFFDLRENDLKECDLLIVIGTSLKVAPFCNTMHMCNPRAPRLLVNRERVGIVTEDSNGNGFKFDQPDNYRDVELLCDCDEGVLTVCEMLGWRSELEELIRQQVPSWPGTQFSPTIASELKALVSTNSMSQPKAQPQLQAQKKSPTGTPQPKPKGALPTLQKQQSVKQAKARTSANTSTRPQLLPKVEPTPAKSRPPFSATSLSPPKGKEGKSSHATTHPQSNMLTRNYRSSPVAVTKTDAEKEVSPLREDTASCGGADGFSELVDAMVTKMSKMADDLKSGLATASPSNGGAGGQAQGDQGEESARASTPEGVEKSKVRLRLSEAQRVDNAVAQASVGS